MQVVPLLHEGSERLSGLTKRLSWAPGAAGEPRGKPDSPLFKADLSRANSEADLHALDEVRSMQAEVLVRYGISPSHGMLHELHVDSSWLGHAVGSCSSRHHVNTPNTTKAMQCSSKACGS